MIFADLFLTGYLQVQSALVALQTHELCGFLQKCFVRQFASFADFKLLDFSQASDSITVHINRMLYVTHYIRYVHINLLWAQLQIINDGPVFSQAKVKA